MLEIGSSSFSKLAEQGSSKITKEAGEDGQSFLILENQRHEQVLGAASDIQQRQESDAAVSLQDGVAITNTETTQ